MVEYVSVSTRVEHTSWGGHQVRVDDRDGIDENVIVRSKDGWSNWGRNRRIYNDRVIMGSDDYFIVTSNHDRLRRLSYGQRTLIHTIVVRPDVACNSECSHQPR